MRRRAFSYGLFALAATAAAGGFVVNRFLDRPAESALALVPANATAVLSLDLVPAPDQVLAFKSIDDMIAKAPGDVPRGALIGAILHEVAGEPSLKPVADQVDRSIALAMLPKDGAKDLTDGEGVALMPLKDPQAIAAWLRTKGKPETAEGVAITRVSTGHMGDVRFSLEGSTLIASSEAWAVARVVKVARGEAKSLVADPAFVAARQKALPSANLLVLASPALVKGDDWLCGSMTIRDTGIEMAVSGQTTDQEIMKAGSLAPLGSDVLAALPRGAYGFFAVAQPGPAVALAGEALDEPSKEIKKETDLDLKSDVLPALGGNVAVGFYPSFGPDAGIDLLVSLDDANGADPASLARKLERILEDKMQEDGKPENEEWKVKVPADGADVSRLADEPTEELRKALTDAEKSFFRPLTLARGKTIAWAMVGRSVLMATSQGLLDRAVAARQHPSATIGLTGDAALGARPGAAADGQFSLAFSMKRLVEGIRNTIDPSHMSPETAAIYRKSLSLYDNVTEPFALRANMAADGRYRGYLSVPFDWTKLPTFVDGK